MFALQESQTLKLERLPDARRSEGIPIANTWRANYLTISAQSAAIKIGAYTGLQGPLDANALKKSHWALLERHESLRTVFRSRPDCHTPVMHVQPMCEELQDFRVEAAESQRAAMEIAQRAAKQSYDQASGPLTRLQVIRWEQALPSSRATGPCTCETHAYDAMDIKQRQGCKRPPWLRGMVRLVCRSR